MSAPTPAGFEILEHTADAGVRAWGRTEAEMLEQAARGLYALQILNAWGVRTVNTAAVAEACGDKFATSTALSRAGVAQPRTLTAFTVESALEAIETPTLFVRADEGLLSHRRGLDDRAKRIRNLTMARVPGGHHCHLDGDTVPVAEAVRAFLTNG